MEQFKDAHYIHTPTQGNIYTTADLKLASGSTILLIASLKREILCFEYNVESSSGGLVPTTREVSFTYIPNGAEIISIDAFNKSAIKNEWVIGVTIIKNSNDSDILETFLNVYSQVEESDDFDIENIAQNCLNVKLDFIPYHLVHSNLFTWDSDGESFSKKTVFILSGSDNQVHIYQENSFDHAFKEVSNLPHFPEFAKTPSPVVWIDVLHVNNFEERITAFGCECGYVKLLKTDTKTNTLKYNFSIRSGNYIPRVYLYMEKEERKIPEMFKESLKGYFDEKSGPSRQKPFVNLVVVNSILPAMFFWDVLEYGFSNYATLPRHDSSMVLTTCVVADIDFDNDNEIILGNSSEELMLVKYDRKVKKWFLEEIRDMAAPILSLRYIDVTGDGVRELVVSSLKGVHILQHDPQQITRVLAKKIEALTIPKIDPIST